MGPRRQGGLRPGHRLPHCRRTVVKSVGTVVQDVKYCSNMDDGCNQDRLTSSSCENNYRLSSAADTCKDETFSQDGYWCAIDAACETGQVESVPICVSTCVEKIIPLYNDDASIQVKAAAAREVENCYGELRQGGC